MTVEFFPPAAGLFGLYFITSQISVKFYCETSWPQLFTSCVMRRELKVEPDNSLDKPKKNKFHCVTKMHYTQNTSRS